MRLTANISIDQIAKRFGAIASKAIGFVFGTALFEGAIKPALTYGRRWLLVAACLSAAFILCAVIEYCIRIALGTSFLFKREAEDLTLRQSIKRRFRGDRTEEEYRRAERVAAVSLVMSACFFLLIPQSALVLTAVLGFLFVADNYVSLKSADRHFKAKVVGELISGSVFGLLAGYYIQMS